MIFYSFRFSSLDLESHRACRYDFVAAFEGATVDRSAEIGRYCGYQGAPPPVLKSRGNVMTVQFKTDRSVAATG